VTASWRRRWLAIDLGDRRVGLALSDELGIIASPAGHLDRRPGKRPPLTALLARATELGADGFVVGLPLGAQGEDTPRAAEARRLAHELQTRTGHPTELVDERFTTAAASAPSRRWKDPRGGERVTSTRWRRRSSYNMRCAPSPPWR